MNPSEQRTASNHALQRTAPAVTLAASAAALPPAMQPARQPPQSLSLGSFDDMNSDATVDLGKLKRLRRNHGLVFSIVALGGVLWIGGVVLTLLLSQGMKTIAGIISTVGFTTLAVMIAFSFSFGKTRCPRCGKPFYTSEGVRGFFEKINYLTRHCVHCGQGMNVEQTDYTDRRDRVSVANRTSLARRR